MTERGVLVFNESMTPRTVQTTSFIGGRHLPSLRTYANIDPATGAEIGQVARSGEDEVDAAVHAAAAAQKEWRRSSPEQRSKLLVATGALIRANREELARLESEDTGKPLMQAYADVDVCARYFDFYGHTIEAYYGHQIPLGDDMHVYTRREPYGVTGHIVAWNYPLQLIGRAAATSLATGNCAVAKPADETPRTTVRLAELIHEAGFPAGAFNVVVGLGAEAGDALAKHPGIAHLGFVGSTATGSLIAHAAADRGADVIGYGTAQQDPAAASGSFRTARVIPVDAQGQSQTFTLRLDGDDITVRLNQPGGYNALNAAAAVCTAAALGYDPAQAAAGLSGFHGTRRRFEFRGQAAGVRVYDDYAHHPTEITALLTAAKDVVDPGGRVHVVFQPHLFSRTQNFRQEFGRALGIADDVVVLDVFPAREDPVPGVTGAVVADEVPHDSVAFLPAFTQVVPHLLDRVRPGDIVLTVGAGDVTVLGPEIVEALGGA